MSLPCRGYDVCTRQEPVFGGWRLLSRQTKGLTYEDSSTLGGNSAGDNGHATALDRRDRFISEYLGLLPPESLVVNIGCGVLRRFEPECPLRYLASDLRVLPHVDFAAGAMSLPLADGSADAVIALEPLEHVPQPLTVLQEMSRVLKPGGRAIMSVPPTVPRHDDHDYWRFTAQGTGAALFRGLRGPRISGLRENLRGAWPPWRVLHGAGIPSGPAPHPSSMKGVPVYRLLVRPTQQLVNIHFRRSFAGVRPALRSYDGSGHRLIPERNQASSFSSTVLSRVRLRLHNRTSAHD